MNESEKQPASIWTKQDWILLTVNIFVFLIMLLAFNHRLPDIVGTHFNIDGEQNGTMPKWQMWLVYSGVGVLLPAFLSIVRQMDPRRQNYARFSEYYSLMRWAISLFIHGSFLLMLLRNLDYHLPFVRLMFGGLGLLWIVLGNRMGQTRSNFFFGIRTPWAISDENNWRSTHRLGGRLWVVSGILMIIGACVFPTRGLTVVLIMTILLCAFIPYLYSYLLYARTKKNQ